MSYYDPSQQQPPLEYTQYPLQPYSQTEPGIPPPPPPYYSTGGLPPQYPMPPQQQPPRLPLWAILLAIAIVAVVGAGVFYAEGKSSSTPTTASTVLSGAQIAATNSAQIAATNAISTVDTTSTLPTPNTAHFKVGDTAVTPDGFIVTILKTYTSRGDQYNTPSAGNQYLITDVSVKNITGQVQHMSNGQFTLTDSTGQQIDHTIALLSSVHYFTGGTLQDGATMRGQLVYDVPKGNHPFELIFMGNMFGNYQTIWDIHS